MNESFAPALLIIGIFILAIIAAWLGDRFYKRNRRKASWYPVYDRDGKLIGEKKNAGL
jgi:membrane protein implicated in regulation of membrane protease activity